MAASQNFGNHRRVVVMYHFVLGGLLFANLVYWIYVARHTHPPEVIVQLVVAVSLMLLFWYSRQFALTVQDRVIRLEMRLRLRGILPPDLHPNIDALTHRQLVALRFASDAEMADLVRDVLAGKLASGKEIKMRVRNWQSDWLRA